MGFIEQIEKEQKIEDFPKNSILSYIAAFPKDTDPVAIAIAVAIEFGGSKYRIHKFATVTKPAQERIVDRKKGL